MGLVFYMSGFSFISTLWYLQKLLVHHRKFLRSTDLKTLNFKHTMLSPKGSKYTFLQRHTNAQQAKKSYSTSVGKCKVKLQWDIISLG